jgi:hypothetical protein
MRTTAFNYSNPNPGTYQVFRTMAGYVTDPEGFLDQTAQLSRGSNNFWASSSSFQSHTTYFSLNSSSYGSLFSLLHTAIAIPVTTIPP